jgi:16S rRNA (adenine(1408)-N(1))-methyltransferase
LREPKKFFIGIDANVRPLAKISEKICRRTEKGGAPNALFLQATAEELPEELSGVASEVRIQFPWGSLLRSVAIADEIVLKNLRRLCRNKARLEVIIGIDPKRDKSELQRLGVPDLSVEYVKHELPGAYEAHGFRVIERHVIPLSDWPEIESTWAKKLRRSRARVLIYLHAEAT